MSKWKLYWVASDGYEDCFVVAKNSRSAKRVEKDMNGFEDEDLTVTRVKDIPDKYEQLADKIFREWSKKNNHNTHLAAKELTAWPYYAEEWLLKILGVESRYVEGQKEYLVEDIVYAPNKIYPIGLKAMKELYELDKEHSFDISKVSYEGIENVIKDMLGEAIVIIHRIEDYISNSFIFAMGNKKYDNYTIEEARNLWKKKFTFGKLINLMEEKFIIQEDVKASLLLFLEQRNKIAHGLTKYERYDIDTLWGQKEIIGYLTLFLTNAFVLEKVIRSAYTTSLGLGLEIVKNKSKTSNPELNKDIEKFYLDSTIKEELNLFIHTFEMRNKE